MYEVIIDLIWTSAKGGTSAVGHTEILLTPIHQGASPH